jgi:hypothetical protein
LLYMGMQQLWLRSSLRQERDPRPCLTNRPVMSLLEYVKIGSEESLLSEGFTRFLSMLKTCRLKHQG